jgi:pSer/pThr/pTyr-binding forkhead associated (FHA) protein
MSGPQKGDYYPLGKRTSVVGRDEALLIQVLDPKVSRKHLRLRYYQDEEHYTAEDLGSKHGVYINGRRIIQETMLAEGDQIRIGETSILFTMKEFPDRASALEHFKKAGERIRETLTD